jgi:glycine betaine catabolism B
LFFIQEPDSLTLKEKNKLTQDTYEFVWSSPKNLNFLAGQYLEWTLPHTPTDSRGNRRYFTISSSPTEENLSIGIKFYDKPSTFKKKLMSLEIGEKVTASSLSGDFTLPLEKSKKIVFIAGGIGITPFRSMVKFLVDKGEKRDAILFFCNKTEDDIVYKDLFEMAKNIGLRTIHVLGKIGSNNKDLCFKEGKLNEEMIKSEVLDFKERIFYISGPPGMVSAFETTLKKMGVSRNNIKTDFFPGYA